MFKEKNETNLFRIIEINSVDDASSFEKFYKLVFDYIKGKGSIYEPIDFV